MATTTILIIDDDQEVAMMLSSHLQKLGYRADFALDGIQGAEKIKLLKPNLLLMDFRMPGGSGKAIYDRLQLSVYTMDIPVIFISGMPPEEIKPLIPSSPRVEYIKKPIDIQTLQGLISKILNLNPANPPPPAPTKAPPPRKDDPGEDILDLDSP